MSDALVFGGYGVFGTQVCRELAHAGTRVIVAGRNARKALALAAALGPGHHGIGADLTVPDSYDTALVPGRVVSNCAGPFTCDHIALVERCLERGCHYTDIADDRAYARLVGQYADRFADARLCAVFGCSSLPAISGALATFASSKLDSPAASARVSLFIGNRNPKGRGAVQAAVNGLGKPIAAPQGAIYGFRDPQRVRLPPPFGERTLYNFNSPDYDLLPARLSLEAVAVKIGFELPLVTRLFAALGAVHDDWGSLTARLVSRVGRLVSRWGSSGGVVQTELHPDSGEGWRAALVAETDGQRMAALPCALATEQLCRGAVHGVGVLTADALLGAANMLARIQARGFRLVVSLADKVEQ